MAEQATSEKVDYSSGSENGSEHHPVAIYERPTGIKGIYYHPITQVVMLGFVCFMGPGIFGSRLFTIAMK